MSFSKTVKEVFGNAPPTYTVKHLWDITHPYYCEKRTPEKYESWDDFSDDYGDTDLNLLFRFDWRQCLCGFDTLKLYFMLQRKGIYRSVEIKVLQSDEPAVIEWLKPRKQKMKELREGVPE